jgi:hypothetical protein
MHVLPKKAVQGLRLAIGLTVGNHLILLERAETNQKGRLVQTKLREHTLQADESRCFH